MWWDKVRYVSSFAKIIRCLDPYKFIMVHKGEKEKRRLLLSIFPCKLGSGKTRKRGYERGAYTISWCRLAQTNSSSFLLQLKFTRFQLTEPSRCTQVILVHPYLLARVHKISCVISGAASFRILCLTLLLPFHLQM